jgi:hypothetical protein
VAHIQAAREALKAHKNNDDDDDDDDNADVSKVIEDIREVVRRPIGRFEAIPDDMSAQEILDQVPGVQFTDLRFLQKVLEIVLSFEI